MILMHAYTYRAYDFERAVRKSVEFGYDGVELVGSHYRIDHLKEDVASMDEILNRHGQRAHVATFGANMLVKDAEQRKANLVLWENAIKAFSAIGVGQLNGGVGQLYNEDPTKSGSAMATEEDYALAVEGLNHLVPMLRDYGMTMSLEIHMHTIHDCAVATKKLLDMVGAIDTIYACPDPGNMYSTPHAEPAHEAVAMLEGYIGYFHAKNCIKIGPHYDYSTTLADGNVDWFKVMSALKATGFKGAICEEYCGAGDPSIAAQSDIRYLKSLLDELEYDL